VAEPTQPVELPADLAALTDEQLVDLLARLEARFDEVNAPEDIDQAALAELAELAGAAEQVRGLQAERETARADVASQRAALAGRLRPADEDDDGGQPQEPEATAEPAAGEPPQEGEPAGTAGQQEPVAAAAATIGREFARVLRETLPAREPLRGEVIPPSRPPARLPGRGRELVITAGADVPSHNRGGRIENIAALADAITRRARSMPPTHTEFGAGVFPSYDQVPGAVVATIENDFDLVVDGERTSTGEMEEAWHELVDGDKAEALLAGGGWCAPSETRYEFYNIVGVDGLIDLPTIGVQRGGIKFPDVSQTGFWFGSVYAGAFTNATNPWLWTEADDIATVSGAPNKPCVRVPCPSFIDVRLECYGICLTAGNLTDNAYPEATANYLRYLLAAHEHAQNARFIAQILLLASATVTGGLLAANAISVDLPAAAEWAAIDYRARFGMVESDVLEMILPSWVRAPIRTDIAARTGRDNVEVTDAEIDRLFTIAGVRPQFVKDWQMRGVNQPGGATPTALYPANVEFLIYPAGSYVKGNGMTLDLGVVRDSVLNAENDFTAAWMEECHLIARFGHPAGRYSVGICAAGKTGIANLANCRTA
jgi:hypothetical protein